MDHIEWQHLITTERILELHEQSLRLSHQKPLAIGAEQMDCVEGRIGNAWLAERYSSEEQHMRSGLCFAGHLMYYLVRNHCFPDGNKRIGWIAAMTVLASLGLTVCSTDADAIDLVMRIAENEVPDGSAVVQWLAARLEAPAD